MTGEDLYDCTIFCGHEGARVHANTFVVTQNCKLLANAYDCEKERRDFHLANISELDMQLVVDVLHKKRRISSLELDELERVMHAFDFLDCKFRYKRIIERLWALCRSLTDVHVLHKHADIFAHSDEHRLDFLLKMRLLTPVWSKFRDVFQYIRMNEKCAIFCLQHLMLFFPAVLVFIDIVNSCPPSFQYDIASSLLGQYRIGVYFHPKEYNMALRKLVDVAPPREETIVRNCIESNQRFESSSMKLHATVLYFTNSPKVSVLIEILDQFRSQRRLKINGLMDIVLNTVDGSLTGTLGVQRMAQHVPFSTNIAFLRTISYVSKRASDHDLIECDYDIEESWKTFEDVDQLHRGEVNIVENDIVSSLQNDQLRFVRLDVFWHRDPRTSLHF